MAIKRLRFWGPFWSYQLNSTANSAHLARFLGKWAKLAVLFGLQFQNGPQDFNFFNCSGCPIFILCIIHCYLCQKGDIEIHSQAVGFIMIVLIFAEEKHFREFFITKEVKFLMQSEISDWDSDCRRFKILLIPFIFNSSFLWKKQLASDSSGIYHGFQKEKQLRSDM